MTKLLTEWAQKKESEMQNRVNAFGMVKKGKPILRVKKADSEAKYYEQFKKGKIVHKTRRASILDER